MDEYMATRTFDTHLFVKTLQQKGFTEQQAEAIIQVAGQMREDDLRAAATKADLRELELNMKTDLKELELRLQTHIADTRADVIKWVVGTNFAMAALILAVLKLHV